MSKQAVVNAFRRHCAPSLKAAGFVGPRGHFVRRTGAVTQVVELQHSIYGGRVTANLGLDLEWLGTLIRWIPQPANGPHAHDSTRWVRIGIVSPAKSDVWWSFSDDPASIDEACGHLTRAILEFGLSWMDAQSDRPSFLRYAEEKLDRSRSRLRPHGSFLELRLMAAVCAWNGDSAAARAHAAHAAELWKEERDRLSNARELYSSRHPAVESLPRVPNLVKELERLIAPGAGQAAFRAPKPARRGRKASRR